VLAGLSGVPRQGGISNGMGRLERVKTIELPTHADPRGVLTAIEASVEVPFKIERIFWVYDVKPPYERGGHAHRETDQLVICVAGTMKIDASDGSATRTFDLNSPTLGLYIPALIWTRLYEFTPDAVCIAAASGLYDHAEVIRDWSSYVELATATA